MVLWTVHKLSREPGHDAITLTDIEGQCHLPALSHLEELASRGEIEVVRRSKAGRDAYVITDKGRARLRFQGYFAEWDTVDT
jgi:hypothetical protein